MAILQVQSTLFSEYMYSNYTLIECQHQSTERVWGAAYHIPATHVAAVRSYLDIREINGYSIQFTPFHPASNTTSSSSSKTTNSDPTPIRCLVYIGLPSNPQFLGAQHPDALARKILASRGPSGENREYLFNLEEALLGLSPQSEDEHISDLVKRCRALEEGGFTAEGEKKGVDGKEEGEGDGGVLRRVGSTEEQEEVER